jgi:hypothetical protein
MVGMIGKEDLVAILAAERSQDGVEAITYDAIDASIDRELG